MSTLLPVLQGQSDRPERNVREQTAWGRDFPLLRAPARQKPPPNPCSVYLPSFICCRYPDCKLFRTQLVPFLLSTSAVGICSLHLYHIITNFQGLQRVVEAEEPEATTVTSASLQTRIIWIIELGEVFLKLRRWRALPFSADSWEYSSRSIFPASGPTHTPALWGSKIHSCPPEATSLLGQCVMLLLHCSPVWKRHNWVLSLKQRRTYQYYLPVKHHTCQRGFRNVSINKQHQIMKRNEWWVLFPLSKEINKGQKYNIHYFKIHQEAVFLQSSDAEEVSKHPSSPE